MPDIFPTDDDIRRMLERHVDVERKAAGAVAGIIHGDRHSIVAHGVADAAKTLETDAVFEIASVTKVFTGLLLADMVERAEVDFDTTVCALLPGFSKNTPTGDGPPITLLNLATHHSGLPRLPGNFAPADRQDPYLDYDAEKLYAFLASYVPPPDAGTKYAYSNLGAGLLGHALAVRAGMSYEELVQAVILRPLGMASTFIAIPAAQAGKVAQGHNQALAPVGAWHHGSLGGCGGLRSSAGDLLKFLAAFIDPPSSPLHHSIERMLACRKPTGIKDLEIGMGWHISQKKGRDIIWHNGMTGGFGSFAAFDPATKTGVAVLANTECVVDGIGMNILCPP